MSRKNRNYIERCVSNNSVPLKVYKHHLMVQLIFFYTFNWQIFDLPILLPLQPTSAHAPPFNFHLNQYIFSDACPDLYLDSHFLLTFQSQPFHEGPCKGSELPELNQSANYVMLCCSLFKWLRLSSINTLSTIYIKCVQTVM